MDFTPLGVKALLMYGVSSQSRQIAPSSAFLFRLWHLSDFVLWALALMNRRGYSGANLLFGLPFSLLQEIPERVNENVIAGCPPVLLGATDFAYPPYGGSIFGSKTN